MSFVSVLSGSLRYSDSSSSIGYLPEVNVGLAADIGTLSYLPKITGNHSLMRELAYSAAMFSAADAECLGLVSRVVPGGRTEVVTVALRLAGVIAGKSPIAVSGTKRILNHVRNHSVPENLDYTAVWNTAAFRTDDITESLRAAGARTAPQFPPIRKAKL
ncbi:ClpP/crotonase-like domain-containing protein [Mycena maculata]|uniref:ClpP/crotonase-like domain-containing protein n=1 Tax=Mycena maculata TaxID=230809 RepID=A0AAD7N1L6_9AGAR|nr:ClpP/crotonase-like domain-containing protein [Mycena maculata]